MGRQSLLVYLSETIEHDSSIFIRRFVNVNPKTNMSSCYPANNKEPTVAYVNAGRLVGK